MRRLVCKWMIAGLMVALFVPALACAQDISGTYALYLEGNRTRGVVGYMRISGQQGNTFSVGIASPTGNPSVDWDGEGSIQGNTGSYSWRFKDGKTGRTTFNMDNAGNLHGQVRGAGVSWDYMARKL